MISIQGHYYSSAQHSYPSQPAPVSPPPLSDVSFSTSPSLPLPLGKRPFHRRSERLSFNSAAITAALLQYARDHDGEDETGKQMEIEHEIEVLQPQPQASCLSLDVDVARHPHYSFSSTSSDNSNLVSLVNSSMSSPEMSPISQHGIQTPQLHLDEHSFPTITAFSSPPIVIHQQDDSASTSTSAVPHSTAEVVECAVEVAAPPAASSSSSVSYQYPSLCGEVVNEDELDDHVTLRMSAEEKLYYFNSEDFRLPKTPYTKKMLTVVVEEEKSWNEETEKVMKTPPSTCSRSVLFFLSHETRVAC